MKEIPDAKIQAWARLIRAQRVLLERVEQRLKDAGMPPLAWYDVLLELDRGNEGLRQYEIGERILLSKHNLSRLLDRMEKEGMLQRRPCPEDGRGSVVSITAEGRKLRRRMWPEYAAAIDEVFAGKITAAQAGEFSNTLQRLLD